MTNRDEYKRAFSTLHASDDISLEERPMNKKTMRFTMPPAIAACLCAVLLAGGVTTAYALDLGGIQQTVRIWLDGEPVDATLSVQEGDDVTTYEIVDADGNVIGSGGGVAIGDDGKETSIPADEMTASIAEDYVSYLEEDVDGTIRLCHYGQVHDITSLWTSGTHKLVVEHEGVPTYFDLEDNGEGSFQYSRSSEPKGAASDYMKLG